MQNHFESSVWTFTQFTVEVHGIELHHNVIIMIWVKGALVVCGKRLENVASYDNAIWIRSTVNINRRNRANECKNPVSEFDVKLILVVIKVVSCRYSQPKCHCYAHQRTGTQRALCQYWNQQHCRCHANIRQSAIGDDGEKFGANVLVVRSHTMQKGSTKNRLIFGVYAISIWFLVNHLSQTECRHPPVCSISELNWENVGSRIGSTVYAQCVFSLEENSLSPTIASHRHWPCAVREPL